VGDSVAVDDGFPNEALDLVGRDGGCSYGTKLYFTSLAYYLDVGKSGESSGFKGLWSRRRCACKRYSDAKVSAE